MEEPKGTDQAKHIQFSINTKANTLTQNWVPFKKEKRNDPFSVCLIEFLR